MRGLVWLRFMAAGHDDKGKASFFEHFLELVSCRQLWSQPSRRIINNLSLQRHEMGASQFSGKTMGLFHHREGLLGKPDPPQIDEKKAR